MDQQTLKPSDTLISISKIQEQLNSLNRKVDMILNKLSNSGQSSRPAPQTPVVHKPVFQQPSKNLFQVICADCKKACSIPFKPTADRPVYCKECFARRRGGQTPKVDTSIKPVVSQTVPAPAPAKVAKKTDMKKSAAKKTTVKKKTVAKKKK